MLVKANAFVNKLFLTSLLLGALGGASAHAEVLNLRIGTEGAYPPWSMATSDGKVSGFDADTAKLICDKLQANCTTVIQEFAGLIPALESGRIDVIISALSITAERRKRIDYSKPYAMLTSYYIAPKNSELSSISDLSDLQSALAGKKVGVQQGTANAEYVRVTVPAADLKTYDSLDAMQIDLSTGRLDAGFSDVSAAKDFLSRPSGENFSLIDVKILSSSHPALGEGVAVGIRQGNSELKEKIDIAVCQVIKDGSLGDSSDKWFGSNILVDCHD